MVINLRTDILKNPKNLEPWMKMYVYETSWILVVTWRSLLPPQNLLLHFKGVPGNFRQNMPSSSEEELLNSWPSWALKFDFLENLHIRSTGW